MSSQLPTIDLTGAVVGNVYPVDFTAFVKFNPANMNQNAHIVVYNESGCGLLCSMQQSGAQFFIPAGGWGVQNIAPNDARALFQVTYILTSAPISQLIATYYSPGEEYPPGYTLGNSPVGGAVTNTGGSVADHLINQGNPASGASIVQITPAGAPSPTIIMDNQGNVTFSGWDGALLTQLLKLIAGAAVNSDDVILGDFNHRVHMLGSAYADKDMNANQFFAGTPSTSNQIRYDTQFGLGTNGVGFRAVFAATDTTPHGFTAQCFSGASNVIGFEAFSTAGITGTNRAFNADGGLWNIGLDATSLTTAGQVAVAWQNGQLLPNGVYAPNSAAFSSGNGSVAGQMLVYCPIWGSALKIAIVQFNGFNTATNVTCLFPSPFSGSRLNIWSGDIGGSTTFGMTIAGVVQGCRQIVYGVAGVAGTTSAQSVLKTANQYTSIAACDGIQVQTTGGSGTSSSILIIGN